MNKWQQEETGNLHMNSYFLVRFVLDWERARKKEMFTF